MSEVQVNARCTKKELKGALAGVNGVHSADWDMDTKGRVVNKLPVLAKLFLWLTRALKKMAGVNSADWNSETKVLEVTYDAAQTNMDEIQKTIAGIGHDTDKYRATTEAYDNLPGCCQYDRPKS